MKKITFLATLLVAFTMNAQVTLFEDDFESYTATDNVGEDTDIPADYLSYDVDGDTFNFGLSNPANFSQPFGDIYSGNFMISASYITIGVGGNGGQGALSPDNILVLPLISIPAGASGVELSYLVGSGTDPAFFSEKYSIQVTTASDEATILAATPELETTLTFQGAETVTIPLDAYVGMDVYISFRHFETTDQWLLGIDNILVEAATLSVGDQTFNGFTYFVDANNQLNLKANVSLDNVQLYNVLGQQVLNQKLSNTSEIVNLSSLKTGVYIATVSIDGNSKTFKIVKR